jgi:hypothetical protein
VKAAERAAINAYLHSLRLQLAQRDERIPNGPPPKPYHVQDHAERIEHQRRVVLEARERYGHGSNRKPKP